ncbi:uncharacterized protein LOC132162188 [Corylus avellana]|uniref:uncharacterized protein LOC132162188 n=1 Tax=Corylus avellana TaxID=13451 RepID=UPI00286BC25D|nr:uncharacterized protein LOC132162188 [Corylus avellana]
MHRSRAEGSSPLATVEDIQRRLLRPPSLHSTPPTSSISSPDGVPSSNSSQFKVSFTEFKTMKKEKKKLEDYLDPVLLSTVSSKIGRAKKVRPEAKPKKVAKDFEWPVDELNVFMADSKSENRGNWRSDEVVDLKDDLDLIGDSGEGEESCTPFRRFERTALCRFKGRG